MEQNRMESLKSLCAVFQMKRSGNREARYFGKLQGPSVGVAVWIAAGFLFGFLAGNGNFVQAQSEKEMTEARELMVDRELVRAGIRNPDVLAAMKSTPRHRFVPKKERMKSYEERALPIGYGQTISSPFVVASMTEALDPQPDDRVLEIGTGSGYQAAVLSPLVRDIYSIEIVTPLARQAMRTLKGLKYENVHVRAGDGYAGWPEAAPFDKIIVTCSPESPPPALVEQLKDGGLMVIPLGERYAQDLCVLRKDGEKLLKQPIRPILFVPMEGAAEENRAVLPDPANPVLVNGDFEKVMIGQKSEIEKMPENRREFEEEQDEEFEDESAKPVSERNFQSVKNAPIDLLIPQVWCYLRQAQIDVNDTGIGEYCLRFRNKKSGAVSQACQGIGVDGREVSGLHFRMKIRGEELLPNILQGMKPGVFVVFIDDKRNTVRSSILGGWRGTFDWREVAFTIDVPSSAREACVYFGLHGAKGTLWIDDVEMRAVH
ncbi:MAG: protein-L-isoaspartate(D-aspartate) O-methyltransferase [Thermoguttaceae bacterium]|nr:protein-L-isoaspartate(D-aspartate) O-methyltransferase [Thermoguttaceae bacterium]